MTDSAAHSTVDPLSAAPGMKSTHPLPAKLGWMALLAAMTFAAYLPAIQGAFIMDDDGLLWESRIVKDPSGLARFWFTADADDYWPMTNSSFWLEWRLWGDKPAGYHVTNLILHIAAAILIWAILQRLAVPGAYLAALLFALHPVNVESIAWISQRKNALAMVFFLVSILWYVRVDEERAKRDEGRDGLAEFGRWYWLSLFAFVLAMLSKGSVAVLPVVLLLIAWWQGGRIGLRDVVRSTPFFVVAGVLTVVNLWFQTHGFGVVIREASFAQRLAGAGAAVWFYLAKVFLPIELLFVYPPWTIEAGQLLWWAPCLGAVVVTAVLWWQRNSPQGFATRPILLAWLFFGVSLAPVLGFTDVGFMKYSLVADHYQHIAIIGVAALVAGWWEVWRQRSPGSLRWAPAAAAAIGVVTLALLTWRQNQFYGDPIALYEATLVKNPTCWMAHNNLGLALVKAKRVPDAIAHYREAVRLKPDFPEALSNWGAALNRLKQPQESIERLREALRLKPDFPLAHNNLGTAYELESRWLEAVEEFEIAVRMDPNFGIAHYNLGYALDQLNRNSEAMDQYREALRLNPYLPEAERNLAVALDQQGKLSEAIEHFQKALKLKSDDPQLYQTFGVALLNGGRPQEAIEQLQMALQYDGKLPDAHNNLGIALTRVDRISEGIEQFREALRLKPEFAEACLNLGVALCKSGKLQEGIQQFEEARRLNPDNINVYTNLMRAYVQLQRPAEAIAAAEQALELARAQGKTAEAGELTAWLASYRSQQAGSSSTSPRSDSVRPVQRP